MPRQDIIDQAMKNSKLSAQLGLLAQMPFGTGASLIAVARTHKVGIEIDDTMDGGVYMRAPGAWQKILTAPDADAGALAHELRHAWQYNAMPDALARPASPREYLALRRLEEADARAWGCVLGMLAMSMQGFSQEKALSKCFDSFDAATVARFYQTIPAIQAKSFALAQAMRSVFETYMHHAPNLPVYEERYAQDMERYATRSAGRAIMGGLTSLFNREAGAYMSYRFTRAGVDKTVIGDMARFFGQMPDGGNYRDAMVPPHIVVNPSEYGRPGQWTRDAVKAIEAGLPSP